MPNVITNADGRTINLSAQTSAIRIDDDDVSPRKTWSSEKLDMYVARKEDSEEIKLYEFVEKYGELYFSEYTDDDYEDWEQVIKDAYRAIRRGETFWVAWSDKRMAQVISADPGNDTNSLIVLKDGLAYANTPDGIIEVVVSTRLGKVRIDTVYGWKLKPDFIPDKGEIIIWSDRKYVDDKAYPGVKIGDGKAYNLDLPFVGQEFEEQVMKDLTEHMHDMVMHVTQEEKDFWNNKLNCEAREVGDDVELVLNRL